MAVFAGNSTPVAPLPRPSAGWGRAWGRDQLDTLLAAEARAAGAEILQPYTAVSLVREGPRWLAGLRSLTTQQIRYLRSPIVVAAHGSWEPGSLPTQLPRPSPQPSDLLAFKAYFHNADLPPDLMPLLAFRGGYGGMIACSGGRVGLSCCIRRDVLQKLRTQPNEPAGQTVLNHIQACCRGVRASLGGARLDGNILAAGPIRPGIRLETPRGIFAIGNAAGEAHPVVAEGISMALQSAWLLTCRLLAWRADSSQPQTLSLVRNDYAAAWRRYFGPRLLASTALAHWAMQPGAVATTMPLLDWSPAVLRWGARLTGKATCVVPRAVRGSSS